MWQRFPIIDDVLKVSRYRKFAAVVLAMLVMVSANGVAIDSHFCGGQLQDLAFFSSAQKCQYYADPDKAQCSGADKCATEHASVQKKSCCSNKAFFAKLGLENSVSFDGNYVVEHSAGPGSLFAEVFEIFQPIQGAAVRVSVFNTGPPLGRTALRILFQVFRI